ncbi:MAG: hypothetical protein MO847_05305 [Candidatus Protistobacter heckmanni]|nr:hypothetical protein [Candidatus Protistobacter heckmanni]
MTQAFAYYDYVGLVGAAIVALAYFLNQKRLLRSDDWRFPGANLLGSCLIWYSLIFNFNLASAVIETFWTSISFYGLEKCLRMGRAGGGA